MRHFRLALLIAVAAPAMIGAAPVATTAAATPADAGFAALSADYLSGAVKLDPVSATQLGDHRFDDKLTDMSAAGRAARDSFNKATLAKLMKIDRTKLSRDNQVDAALLENQLRSDVWSAATLGEWQWDPQIYNGIAGGALYGLAARDFAPWPVRLKAATARMEALPALYQQARANLVPAKVPEIYATTVAKQNGGVIDIAESMLAPHKGELSAADAKRFDAALVKLKAAVAEQQTWLDKTLVPNAKGDFRLGAKLYDQKLAFALNGSLTRQEIKTRAEQAVADTRAQMYAIAQQVLKGKDGAPPLPETPTAAQQQKGIEAALDLTYADRAPRDGVRAATAKALVSATDFVRAKGLVTVPDTPVETITMPKFQQGVAVAYCDSPGPLDKGLGTFVAVSPVPDDWSGDQANSFLREYNKYMIQDLAVHEGMPGHYLQLAHANAEQSTLRAVLGSGPFIEGWAVYGEGMMADQGYMDGNPLFKLTVLKMRLRSITNSLLDIGIQTGGMTRDQAMALMMNTAFQQEREAAGKWVRANLGSVQLLSYFTGYSEHMALRAEAMKREGKAFDLKTYNDAVLAHGSPPIRYVRELMFDLPIA